jgi:hypothetical protein
MNRHERRAAKARARRATLDRTTAVHEAGHAVARILTASDFGISEDIAVERIEIGSGSPMGESSDGHVKFISLATTYGPMLTAELQDVFSKFAASIPPEQIQRGHITEALKLAETSGSDLSVWLRARMLMAVFGAVAEARYLGKNVHDVWDDYSSESDVRGAVMDGLHAGLEAPEISDFIEEAIRRATFLIRQPEVWSAIVHVADNMPNRGEMPGSLVATIAKTSLTAAA